ncbi:MAG: hypothetical protein ACLR3C_15715 [Eggerthella lenta]
MVFCEGIVPGGLRRSAQAGGGCPVTDEFMLSYGWYHPLWDDPCCRTRTSSTPPTPTVPCACSRATRTRCG